MRVTRLLDYWRGIDGYCNSYNLITRSFSVEDIKQCGKEVVLFGWFPEAVPVVDVLAKAGIHVKYVCDVGQIPNDTEDLLLPNGIVLRDYRELVKEAKNYFFIFYQLESSVDKWTSPLVKRVRLIQYKGVEEFGIVANVRTGDLWEKPLFQAAVFDSINEIFKDASFYDWGAYWHCWNQAGIDIHNWDYQLHKIYEMYKDKPKQAYLEIGPGVGVFSLALKKLLDIDITWLNIPYEEKQWAEWRKKTSRELYGKYDIKIKEAYVELEDFDGEYDIILLSQVMEHFVFNPIGTIKKLVKHLKLDGTMFVSLPDIIYTVPPNVESYKEIPYPEELTKREIKRRILINDFAHFHEYSFNEAMSVFEECGLKCIAHKTNTPVYHFVLKKA